MAEKWHTLSKNDVFGIFNSSEKGLSGKEADARLADYGSNKLEEEKKVHPLLKYANQFKEVLMIMLIIAAAVSYYIGHVTDAIVIMLAVVVNTTMGFIQEYKAEKAMEALRSMTTPTATVLRDGLKKEISSIQVVPGDIILIERGDKIPADARLIVASNLEVDESSLTGESVPVRKDASGALSEIPLGERKNMVYMGTLVTHGRGKSVVVGTGARTEFGKIHTLMKSVGEELTPLQKRLKKLGAQIGTMAVIVCTLLFAIEFMRYYPDTTVNQTYDALLLAVSLAVAVIPEGLPIVVTITLAMGMSSMARRNAVVKKLMAAETLGSTTFICSDKTGTLTKNEMTVREVYTGNRGIQITGEGYDPSGKIILDGEELEPGENKDLAKLLEIAVLCNNAQSQEEDVGWKVIGNPTEGALLTLAKKAGMDPKHIREEKTKLHEFVFNAELKRMTTINKGGDGLFACVKGAPGVVLERSGFFLRDGEKVTMTEQDRERILERNREMAGKSFRVLALAYRELETPQETQDYEDRRDHIEKDLVFVGLAGIYDPPREEVKRAIEISQNAGIRVVMITGDQKTTAEAIAKELGILKEGTLVVTGSELDAMGEEDLKDKVEDIAVYARVTPEHKMRIVRALKVKGHVVAMTGDGVNDAPALTLSDIGVAMGITGTDVSKEAADIVLMDDNFNTIVAAVEEGRKIFDNIRRFLRYQLSTNVGALILIFAASLLAMPPPLFPVQILWINILVDGPPALSLGAEPPDPDIMNRPPRRLDEKILSRRILSSIIRIGIIRGVGTLLVFWFVLQTQQDIVVAKTMAFTTFIMFQLFNIFNTRSERYPLHKIGIFSNKPVLLAVTGCFLLQLMVVYVPVFQGLLGTTALTLNDWILAIGAAATIFIIEEGRKMLTYKRKNTPSP